MKTKHIVSSLAVCMLLGGKTSTAVPLVKEEDDSFLGKVYNAVPDFLKPAEKTVEEKKKENDLNNEFEDIVKSNGFSFEEHEVKTDDGYILKTFRVRNKDTKDGAPVAFLQHGLIDSADAFIMNGFLDSPAFILAEEGYDVWLGNNRGNRFSRKHESLDPDSWDKDIKYKFWDFSFQEMADHDALSNLNYVTDKTGVK